MEYLRTKQNPISMHTQTGGVPSIQKKSVNYPNIWSSNRKLGKHQQRKKFMSTAFGFLSEEFSVRELLDSSLERGNRFKNNWKMAVPKT